MTLILKAWSLEEEKRAQEICGDQPEPGRLDQKADAAEQEKSPRPPPPPPSPAPLLIQKKQHQQQPPEVQAAAIEQVVETEEKRTVVEVERVISFDGDKGIMESMTMDTQEELLQQQPKQQQSQLPGAAAPNPWPLPLSVDLDERNNELQCGRQELVLGGCGVDHESNNEREIGREIFLVFGLGGGIPASVALGKHHAKGGGQSSREQDGSDWKREGIGTEWSSGWLVSLGCEAAY